MSSHHDSFVKKHKRNSPNKKNGAKRRRSKTTRRMSVEKFVDKYVEGMLRVEEAQQFDHQLTPEDKKEMESMGIARVAGDDIETQSGMTRSEQAEAGVKAEAWKQGRPVRIWKLG